MPARNLTGALIAATLTTSAPTAVAQDASPLPRPPKVRVTQLPTDSGTRPYETSVAVNPRDARQVLVSYGLVSPDDRPDAPAGAVRVSARVAWSRDGGERWAIADGTPPRDYLISGDPSVTFDLHGHAFLCYIAFDHTGQRWYWSKGASRNGIFVRRSLDGGRTWEGSHTALIEYPAMTDPPFQDKGYLVADNNASSPYAGNLYVGWTRYSLDKSEILFSRSTDDGKTWSPPLTISTEPGTPRGSVPGAVVGFHAAAGPDGTVYAIWPDGYALVLAVSRDGGRSFEPSRRVVPATDWGFFSPAVTDFPGAHGLPSIGVIPRGSPSRLLLIWADYRYGDVDVLGVTSTDGGRRWGPPFRVNDDPRHGGKDQALPWATVDPSDGAVYVLYYDRRADPKNVLPRVTLARSVDGGRTFSSYDWSGATSDPRLGGYGDYFGIAALNGRVYGAWMENVPRNESEPREVGAGAAGAPPAVIRIGIADFGPPPRATERGARPR